MSLLSLSSYWKDLGYLLVYLTGRPDIQKEYIMKFLATNAFPLGVVACSDSISTDTHTKTLYLARLIREVCTLHPVISTSVEGCSPPCAKYISGGML